MTNFILGAIATIVVTIATLAVGESTESEQNNQVTEFRVRSPEDQLDSKSMQIEIYENVMDECVINN